MNSFVVVSDSDRPFDQLLGVFANVSPWVWALIGFLVGVGLIGLLLGSLRIRRLRRKARTLRARLRLSEEVLSTSADGYMLWLPRDGAGPMFVCSRRLAVLLDLSQGEKATFEDVSLCFIPEDRARLYAALEALHGDGTGFSIDLREDLRDRLIRAVGVEVGWAQGDVPTHVIWMRDITSEAGESLDLKRRLDGLDRERSLLRLALDTIPALVWCRDDSLAIVEWNSAFARASDLPSEVDTVLSGRELLDGPPGQEIRLLAARAQEQGEPYRGRFHAVIEGERRLLEIQEIPVISHDTGAMAVGVGFAQDITAIEEVENRLVNEIEANAEILERLNSGIALFSVDTHLRFYNTAFAKLWKLDPAFLAGRPAYGDMLERLREGRRLPEVADFPAYKAGELSFFSRLMRPREDILHLPDGATLRRVIAPHPLGGLIVTIEDVTDSLALERAFTQLSAVIDETVAHLQEGLAICDATGMLRWSSPAFAIAFGLTPPLKGMSSSEFLDTVHKKIRSSMDAEQLRMDVVTRRAESGSFMLRNGRIVKYWINPLSDGGWMMSVQ